jgi:hypothetical protein
VVEPAARLSPCASTSALTRSRSAVEKRRQEQVAALEDVNLRERQLAALAIRCRRLHQRQQVVGDLDHRGVEGRADPVLGGAEDGVDGRVTQAHWRAA